MRDDQLQAFVSAARARTAVDTRRHRRWLQRQLDESQTFEGLCRSVADSGARVRLSVASGHTHSGRIVAAGADLLALAGDTDVVYIVMSAVVAVELLDASQPGAVPAGIRASTVADAVVELAELRETIVVGTSDGGVHRGRVAGIGHDVLWFDNGCHVRFAAITEVAAAS